LLSFVWRSDLVVDKERTEKVSPADWWLIVELEFQGTEHLPSEDEVRQYQTAMMHEPKMTREVE
jgi:hypothetical protein